MTVGCIESNWRGVQVSQWNSEDLEEWLHQVGLNKVSTITNALQGRGGDILLEKNFESLELSETDKKQLQKHVDLCFRHHKTSQMPVESGSNKPDIKRCCALQ
jgi:hypothetical protein